MVREVVGRCPVQYEKVKLHLGMRSEELHGHLRKLIMHSRKEVGLQRRQHRRRCRR